MEDELLRVVEREIQENTRALARPSSSAPSSPSSCCPSSPSRLVRGAARRVLGIAMSSSAASSPTRRSPARSPRGEQASSDLAGTSGSAPEVPAGIRSEEEARPEQHQATHTRSGYAAMMRSALAKIQEGADDSEGQAAFAEMEDAMTGLMELTYGKPELPNMPEPPHEFATKWPRDDADPLHSGVMDDPVILASGYSVDRSYHQWSCPQKNICPVTNETLPHSFIASNHLLRDMIAAWRIDHLTCSSSSTADTLSIPMIPSEEQIQDILQKLSGNSALQKQALHEIQRLSKITKGEQPCLHKWVGLLPELINLRRNWKSTWTQNLEEQRLTIILNLSVHRPNREILAGSNQLPDALKKIVDKLHKLGNPVSPLAKVASIVAILSEFDMFRKGILGNGGMGMLRDLLKIEDVVVRKEAIAAIRGLCTDHEGKTHALSHNMADALLECLMVTDEVLLLLDCLPKDSCVVDKICGKAVELVNIIMVEQGTGPVTPEATYSAISLVHAIVQRDVGKMGQVKNLEDLKDRLRELSSGILPMQTLLQVDRIINVLSEMFPAPARQVQN
ncbi:U-box domain-containing protein 73-like [Phragmites australis]|uniref:U-box domain-containing protein 73-like n=1 Tax=Phragmites australis TaxID=29695 RepID=UPI002D793BCD|nr:U-box domain-containing protein 73-like [Phragmites australis]